MNQTPVFPVPEQKKSLAATQSVWVQVFLVLVLVTVAFIAGERRGIDKALTLMPSSAKNFASDGSKADFRPFWRVWNTLNEKYLYATSTVDVKSEQARVWGATEGLAGSLGDPYTVFFPPRENEQFKESLSGNFDGVGMFVGMESGIVTVISPIKDTPAFRAGVKAGDKIIAIGATSTAGMSQEEAISYIRGPRGTEVSLQVAREGEKKPLTFKMIRDVIQEPTVDTEIKEHNGKKVFLIKFYSFNEIAIEKFTQALAEFKQTGSKQLVIDLRNNPGGYLNSAVDIASWFIEPGQVVVTEDFKGEANDKVHRAINHKDKLLSDDVKIVVLINKGSASASEILAGALQDYGKAVIVGENSFGKGLVQELVDITPETSLKVTVARWLTPKGRSISNGGLTPDYIVKIAENATSSVKTDPQLDKALELLTQTK
jgi:carboxyl-terminal processing protease